jgi:hypothetical protein
VQRTFDWTPYSTADKAAARSLSGAQAAPTRKVDTEGPGQHSCVYSHHTVQCRPWPNKLRRSSAARTHEMGPLLISVTCSGRGTHQAPANL